ncbi:hypothetical protein NMY22_g2048 [Coprinellus aureogranulatus]|nr:hypothetical protein NMY22_g2048 [Coprinellus aureogranulatus]
MSSCTVNVVQIAPHLVSSNDPPSSLEAASIQEAIAAEKELIAVLKEQVKAAKARVRQYQVVLSPCRRLPPDILAEVFLRIPPEDEDDDAESYQEIVKPLVLVCKKWRDAAVAAPRLWSKLCIRLSKKQSPAVAPLSSWLGRSGNVPKKLSIHSADCSVLREKPSRSRFITRPPYDRRYRTCFNGNPYCVFATPALAEALCKMKGRCDSISLGCSSSACAQNFARSLRSTLSSSGCDGATWHTAKSFIVLGRRWQSWPASPHFLSRIVPASVTSLQLCLSDVFGDAEESHTAVELKIPSALLERLTYLYLSGNICGRHLYPLLRQCRNLNKLTLNYEGHIFEESYGPPYEEALQSGVFLPKLRTLTILDAFNVTGLEVLKMPALVELAICFAEDVEVYVKDREGPERQFGMLVSGHLETNTTLRSLTIERGDFAENTLYDTLRRLTALEHLTLDQVSYPRDMFLKLSTPIPYLSKLKTLGLFHVYGNIEKIQHLSDFVEERGIELATSCYDGETWGSDTD